MILKRIVSGPTNSAGRASLIILSWQLASGRFYTKLYARGWRKASMRFKPTELANFRKDGCISMVRLFLPLLEVTLENFRLIPLQTKGIYHP